MLSELVKSKHSLNSSSLIVHHHMGIQAAVVDGITMLFSMERPKVLNPHPLIHTQDNKVLAEFLGQLQSG